MRSTGTAGTNSRAENSDAEKLLALDSKHLYRAVAEGTYQPRDIAPEVWQLATPLACEILTADVVRPSHDPQYNGSRRSLLAGYLSWLAADDPDLLTVELALSETEILRYLATAAKQRRSSHRSQVALRSSLRSFRTAFPDLFTPTRVKGGGGKELPPTEDWQYDIAYEVCAGFQKALTRQHARTLLVACRSAGLDTSDLRWLTGKHIERRPGARTVGRHRQAERRACRTRTQPFRRHSRRPRRRPGRPVRRRQRVSSMRAKHGQCRGVTHQPPTHKGRPFVHGCSRTATPGMARRTSRGERTTEHAVASGGPQKPAQHGEPPRHKHAPAAPELDRFTAYELGGVVPKRKRTTEQEHDSEPADSESDNTWLADEDPFDDLDSK